MKIQNIYRKNRSVAIMGSAAVFDEHGIAEVDDAIGAQLLKLGGYCRPGNTSATPPAQPTVSAPEANPDLDSMSAAQLKKLAKEQGIDIGDTSKKAELIEIIERARSEAD